MSKQVLRNEQTIMWVSATFIVAGLGMRFFEASGYGNIFLFAASLIAVLPITIKAGQALRLKTFSIELLVTIAVIGAILIGEYVEASIVTFLFLFGAYLERGTLEKTRSSIRELTEIAPQAAVILKEDGSRETIDVNEVKVGDRLVILPGGKIPVDGMVAKGEASINESMITGESAPVLKDKREFVYSGTVVENGYVEIIAEQVGDDTTFAKMIELVEEAQDSQTRAERFLDKFASWYTPSVVILAVIVYIVTREVHLAITFLVVACPGALVIGAPVSNVSGIGNGAQNGVLIKGGEVIERLSKVDTLVFDKTGTLTKGKPEVTELKLFDERQEADEVLSLVAKAETVSEHHLGKTILTYAEAKNVDYNRQTLTESKTLKGRGLIATVEKKNIAVGNRRLMEEFHIQLSENIVKHATEREKLGNTVVFIAVNKYVIGLISIADNIREDAKKTLQVMRNNGIKRIIMLTGDNAHTAEAVARALDIEEYYSELMPEEKVAYVKQFKEKGAIVSMAGDGVNDAPAIAAADIGLAMGESGTDVSMETADVVLMADKLHQYAHAFSLAKATMRNLKQNIILAVLAVFFLLAGVLFGVVNLAIGMFIHEVSVLVVILNAMRLMRFKSPI